MSWLDGTLSDRVRNEEEVEFAIDNFGLLNEASINISTLRGVENLSLVRSRGLLKESLSHTLIDDDECDMWECFSLGLRIVLVSEDLLELVELELDDLLSH